MSGYNVATGIFELNESKAMHYLRRPDGFSAKGNWMDYCAELFRGAGFLVLRKTPYGIDVVADDAQVWEVLSGQPATWGHAKPTAQETYELWQKSRQWFNATDLGKSLSPSIGPVKVNRLLEELGYQVRSQGGWVPTAKAAGLHELRGGSNAYGNGDQQIPIWSRAIIDILQDKLVNQPKRTR